MKPPCMCAYSHDKSMDITSSVYIVYVNNVFYRLVDCLCVCFQVQSSRVAHYTALSKLFPEVDKNVKPYICGVIQTF